MGKEENKTTFCQSNKCSCLVVLFVIAGVVALVCVTFLAKDLRDIYDHDDTVTETPWWKSTIIYQIYPRSFQDSDGDGIGDLQGIISRLCYFNYLNVGAIWLSPFFTSPMRDFGYDVSNYTEVDNIFGTMDDFDNLMKEAKSKGIKVIIDFVPNHTSNESIWFEKSRSATDKSDPYWDFYIWNNGTMENGQRKPPNNWQSVFKGSAWEWDDVRKAYYYHAFLASQPDLNYRNEHVLDKMDDVIRFWMDKGVDGLRIDAIPHLFEITNQSKDEPQGATNGFDENLHKYTKNQPEIFGVVKRWRDILNTYEAGIQRFLLAETVGIPHEARMKYYEAGSMPFFFDLIPAKETCNATASCFEKLIKDGVNLTEGQWPNFVVGNHDQRRIADRIGQKYVDAMNMMLLTLPGTPTTYYGEELGMRGGNYTGMRPKDPYAITSNNPANSRDSERNPMQWDSSDNAGFTNATSDPWLPITSYTNYKEVNVKVERNKNGSSLDLYKTLAELRQNKAFQSTSIEFPTSVAENVLVYVRGEDKDRYLVALNLGKKDAPIIISKKLATKGTLTFHTKPRHGPLDLSNIPLKPGEGIIVHLDE